MLGSIVGGALSYLGGRSRNRSQIRQARAQMDFQERMSNTGYQRAMKDLKAANLNPILAARLGPATTPGGAMAQIGDELTPAVSTAMQVAQTQASSHLQNQQASLISFDKTLKTSQAELNQVNKQLLEKTLPLAEAAETIAKNLLTFVQFLDREAGLTKNNLSEMRDIAIDWTSQAIEAGANVVQAVEEKIEAGGKKAISFWEWLQKEATRDWYDHDDTFRRIR